MGHKGPGQFKGHMGPPLGTRPRAHGPDGSKNPDIADDEAATSLDLRLPSRPRGGRPIGAQAGPPGHRSTGPTHRQGSGGDGGAHGHPPTGPEPAGPQGHQSTGPAHRQGQGGQGSTLMGTLPRAQRARRAHRATGP